MRMENRKILDCPPACLLGGSKGLEIRLTTGARESQQKSVAKLSLPSSSFTLFILTPVAFFLSVEETEAQRSQGTWLRPHSKYGFLTLPGTFQV